MASEQLETCIRWPKYVHRKDDHGEPIPGCTDWQPVTAPAEPAKEVESRSSLKRKAVMRGEKMPTFPAEPPHVACSCPMCCPAKYEIKVQSALRGIRDIVKGRCNHLDLEIIREIINEAIGHEQV